MAGAGFAACAVYCAPPVLGLLGIAGAGGIATIATVAFAGGAFGLVVLLATVGAAMARRRRTLAFAERRPAAEGPVDVTTAPSPHANRVRVRVRPCLAQLG